MDTNYVVPVVGVAKMPAQQNTPDFVVVFDNVVDFGNIGTIIRTSHSFGINTFVSTNNQLDPYQRKTIDASRGSVFTGAFRPFETPKQPSIIYEKRAIKLS